MDDLISRQAAIDAIFSEPLYESGMKKRDADEVVPAIYEKIKAMPPAQPERKTGYKINQHQYPAKWVCSECGAKHFDFSDNFCSQCGADVRGEQDE
jgi:rubrerythrin